MHEYLNNINLTINKNKTKSIYFLTVGYKVTGKSSQLLQRFSWKCFSYTKQGNFDFNVTQALCFTYIFVLPNHLMIKS